MALLQISLAFALMNISKNLEVWTSGRKFNEGNLETARTRFFTGKVDNRSMLVDEVMLLIRSGPFWNDWRRAERKKIR